MRVFLLLLPLALSACAHTSGQRLSDTARTDSAVFYVEKQPKDGRHLEALIAESLQSRGINASSGPTSERPGNANYIVTYEDRWTWDMRMYLRDLKIDVRDAVTGVLMGTAQSYQDSLAAMGMTHRDVIERVMTTLFDGNN